MFNVPMYMSNFGGQFQYGVVDPAILAGDYPYLNLTGNLQNPGMQQMWPQFQGMTNPSQSAVDMYSNAKNSLLIQRLISSVTSAKSEVTSIISSKELTESQKTRLQAELDKITALEEKIKALTTAMSKQQNASETTAKLTELQEEWVKVSDDLNETVKAISEEKAGKADGSEKSDSSKDSESADKADDSASDAEDNDAPATRKLSDKEQKALDYTMTKICDLLDKAIDGPGTNYDDDENGIKNVISNNINKDNVLELLNKWDECYKGKGSYSGGDDNYGLIGSLMNDCEGSQKQEIASMIIEALAERAFANGTDVSKEVSAARASLKSDLFGMRDDDKICNAVNALKNKVASEENKIKKTTTKKSDKAKTEKEQKAKREKAAKEAKEAKAKAELAGKQQEKIDKETKQFIEDMKECLENDEIKALPAAVEIVKDEKGNFKGFSIRLKGKEYFGKDYLSLVAALEKDGRVLPTK